MSPREEPLNQLLHHPNWNGEPGAIWLASVLRLRRNLVEYKFPSKLQKSEANQVLDRLRGALYSLQELQSPKFYSKTELGAEEQELIMEHFHLLSGAREPLEESGVLIDTRGHLLALINQNSHLELNLLDLKREGVAAWNTLALIESELGKTQGYAFSPKFGYLTSNPEGCGTALTFSAYLHLPALVQTGGLAHALESIEEEGLTFTTFSGQLDDPIGDLLIVQNTFTLGISEEAILRSVERGATKLVGAERAVRSHLLEEHNLKLEDQMSKSFGLLVHSVQLGTKEALNLLSQMKLGLALGVIENVEDQKLTELLFTCRRGHLSHLFPDVKGPEDLAKKRAEFLQKELAGISLSGEKPTP